MQQPYKIGPKWATRNFQLSGGFRSKNHAKMQKMYFSEYSPKIPKWRQTFPSRTLVFQPLAFRSRSDSPLRRGRHTCMAVMAAPTKAVAVWLGASPWKWKAGEREQWEASLAAFNNILMRTRARVCENVSVYEHMCVCTCAYENARKFTSECVRCVCMLRVSSRVGLTPSFFAMNIYETKWKSLVRDNYSEKINLTKHNIVGGSTQPGNGLQRN